MNLYQLIILCLLVIALNFLWNFIFRTNVSDLNNEATQSMPHLEQQQIDKKKTAKSVTYFYTILAILPLISGIWVINYWFGEFNRGQESKYWEPYQGKMLEKKISQNIDPTVSGHQLSGRTYYPDVKYEFEHKGKTIIWNRIDFSNRPSSGDKSKSQEVLDMLPDIGEPVKVYFSLEKRQAVLIRGSQNSNYLGLIGGGIFFIIGLIAIKLIYQ